MPPFLLSPLGIRYTSNLAINLFMQDSFVADPNALVSNGQTVKVRVQVWDPSKNRLSLTMKLDSGPSNASNGGGDDGQARRNPRQGKVATAGTYFHLQLAILFSV